MAKKLTSAKAKEILHDKSVHGHPLTDKQRRFFGAIAGGAKPYKAEEGGWLDKYEQGGLVLKQKTKDNYGTKPNVNDDKATYPDGFVGWEYDITGRNYSPAWGGQFKDGGNLMPAMAGANQTVPMAQNGLTFLEPTSKKLPKGYVIPFNTPSTELAMSIGGEQGEPAYLIPSFKYGKPLKDPVDEFRKTGEHLGGPFKTYQEADEWERTVRHPYVEKGQSIPTPLKRWGKDFQMGGSLPGAVGFTYARTVGAAPDNGPYAKKTKASAQNGQEMKYYQAGLDFKPKTISQDGSEIPVDPNGYWNPDNWGKSVIIPSTDITMKGVDQPLVGISDTGDVQYMEPGEDYEFDGEYVTEYPVAQKGDKIYSYKDIKAKSKHPYSENDPRSRGLFNRYVSKKIKELPVETIKTEQPKPVLTDYFQGQSVFAPTPYGGGSAFVGYKTPQGDTVFVKPEDYERMGVPEYGKKFIESKKQRNGGVNKADEYPIEKLDQLLNFTNYNKPTKGGWLDKYN
jgi:hypothetical protein